MGKDKEKNWKIFLFLIFLKQERQLMRKETVNQEKKIKVRKVCGKANIITNETEEAGCVHGKISLMSTAELCFPLSE